MKTEAVMSLGGLALSRLRLGDLPGAYEAADRGHWYVRAARPIVYWLHVTLGAIAEVYLTLIETGWAPDRAVRSALPGRARETVAVAARLARHFPMGVPQARLWQGLVAYTRGRRRRAMRLWRRTLVAAERYRTPYEGARAHLEIGRHLPLEAHGRRHHLHQAESAFQRLGCVVELGRVRDELAHSDELLRGEP
jgi:hypothetical protein